MKFFTGLFLTAVLLALAGCGSSNSQKSHDYQSAPAIVAEDGKTEGDTAGAMPETQSVRPRLAEPPRARQSSGGGGGGSPAPQQVSLQKADEVQAQNQIAERKIIRNGELTIEAEDPQAGQRKITSIAETLGGFVVTSEFKQNDARAAGRPSQIVTIVVRVPASEFNAAIEAIRAVGDRIIIEKATGQDVTEEYIDLEARIKTKKALEAQFLEIMKRATRVSDALEVQSQIADVRAEIESLEGRRRFLENRAALSTINITLQTAAPVVTATTSGFWHDVKEAFGDGIDAAAAIITGLIRFFIVMTPVIVLILLPLFFIGRFLFRRWRQTRKEEPLTISQ
jgi:hypothetical protein